MPTLNQIRSRVDTWLSGRWDTVVARQEQYRAVNGVYWQGLRTHTGHVEHVTSAYGDAVADNLADHPGDVPESWMDLFPAFDGLALPMVLVIDAYEGPEGLGFAATVYARYNGTIYRRTQNHGPEAHRTRPWHAVMQEVP